MKTKTFFIVSILLVVTCSFSANSQNPDFSGEWKLNREKTVLADDQLFLSEIVVRIKGDSLYTTRFYQDGNGQVYPFDENLTLDGKECKIVIYDMPRTSKASRVSSNGAIIVESKTTFYGNNGEDNLNSKETWKIENEGPTLTISFINNMAAGEVSGTNYYNKVK
jgi:hypothetical protein